MKAYDVAIHTVKCGYKQYGGANLLHGTQMLKICILVGAWIMFRPMFGINVLEIQKNISVVFTKSTRNAAWDTRASAVEVEMASDKG